MKSERETGIVREIVRPLVSPSSCGLAVLFVMFRDSDEFECEGDEEFERCIGDRWLRRGADFQSLEQVSDRGSEFCGARIAMKGGVEWLFEENKDKRPHERSALPLIS